MAVMLLMLLTADLLIDESDEMEIPEVPNLPSFEVQ